MDRVRGGSFIKRIAKKLENSGSSLVGILNQDFQKELSYSFGVIYDRI